MIGLEDCHDYEIAMTLLVSLPHAFEGRASCTSRGLFVFTVSNTTAVLPFDTLPPEAIYSTGNAFHKILGLAMEDIRARK